ncbi:hypothetical protein PRIPAC_79556 [Pristionchus pacificus]|uniref:CUB domain-containing protein n=1 Tax=Pristionchus pacificus TaxID=54126 RepID=A0A2A6CJ37_PRIPA|nr:hypothetical protein PRIPAC_79556 [Pristionchus pacificus]|eukprot:PDM78234.1 CUB domain-containing protein [Pristionchus pacificus]
MKLVLLLAALPVLALSCADGFNTWLDGRCFRMNYYASAPYVTAFDQCARDNTRLPAINSQEENDQFFSALKQQNAFIDFSFWLSLTCDGSKFVWADGTEAEYTNFAANYTCTKSSMDRRYYVDTDRLWIEADQQSFYYAVNVIVCEALQRSSSPCDTYDALDATDTCYKLQKDEMSWKQAEETCNESGGHLAVIHNEIFNDFILKTAEVANLHDGVHIGIKRDDESSNYTWADGSDIDYNNFAPGFPIDDNGPCVAMQTGFIPGEWMNTDCYFTRLPFVCTKPAYSVTSQQPSGCPVKKQYAPGDEIFSPSYPLPPGVGGCQYLLLERDQNKRVAIEIDFFESNSCCDSLTIYDGLFGSNILQTITGYLSKPVTIRATSNAMRLVWNAKSGAHVRGFHAKMSTLSCGYGFDTWLDGRCFLVIDFSSAPYDTAFDRCARDDARLPAIRSHEENEQIFAALKKINAFADFSFWLSLSCDGSKFVWADGTEAEYTNFAANYTCTESSKDRLYYVDNHRLWQEAEEDFTLIYYYAVNYIVCEGLHRSSSPCDTYNLRDSTDTCYKLMRDGMTWMQAEEMCNESGGHLAVIHDQTLNDFIVQTADAANLLDRLHIGMKRDDKSGNFTWVDGSVIDYNDFVPGFPKDYNGPCVTMQTGFMPGMWMNTDCYYTRLPYVCTKNTYLTSIPQPAGCPVKTQYAPGDEAVVEIDFFESNSCCDSLTIYDGLAGSNILQTITGYLSKPVTIRGVSNAMRLVWNATSGTNVRGFHAKMSTLSCADGNETWLDGRCFRIFYPISVGYGTALDQCEGDNSRLPAIKNQQENEQIISALKKYNAFADFSFWLSLTCDGSKFVWADVIEAEYTNFAANCTCSKISKGHRYYIDKDGRWYGADGHSFDYPVNSVVCERLGFKQDLSIDNV